MKPISHESDSGPTKEIGKFLLTSKHIVHFGLESPSLLSYYALFRTEAICTISQQSNGISDIISPLGSIKYTVHEHIQSTEVMLCVSIF